MRLFIYDNTVINVDNDNDAANLLADENCERELTLEEITTIFGNYAKYAGIDNTTVVDGVITFDETKLPNEVTQLEEWINLFVRSDRNKLLGNTDFLYRSDIENMMTEQEKTDRDNYCQLLRDFTSTFTEIGQEIVWPTKPVFANVSF